MCLDFIRHIAKNIIEAILVRTNKLVGLPASFLLVFDSYIQIGNKNIMVWHRGGVCSHCRNCCEDEI